MFRIKISLFFYLKSFFICLLFLCSCYTYGQEICNNGIDDDANGLIDLNDSAACTCTPPAISLIPNPSFNAMNCCPSSFSQMNCAQNWVQASSATADYLNTCGFVFGAASAAGLVPFPNGNGIAGIISSLAYKEYLGACLVSTMFKDSTYTIHMNIASTPISNVGSICNGGLINYVPSDIVIYGSANCADIPFAGQACPPSNWQILGTALYTPINSWGTITITFIPSIDINAIIIGSPCVLPPSYNILPCHPYFYFDNLFLNKETMANTSVFQTGNWCNNDAQLVGNPDSIASFQWYLAGVALVGQISDTLDVSGNNLPLGSYTLAKTIGALCSYASITLNGYSNPPVITPVGPFCNYESPVVLSANIVGGIWSGNGITDSIGGIFDPAIATIGSHEIYYTIFNSGNCPRADTISIIINDSAVSNAGSDTSFCSGGINYIGAPPMVGYTYSWTPYTGISSTSDSKPSITEINTGSTPLILNYSLITTFTASGCQALDQVVVTINPSTYINPAGPFCLNSPIVNLVSNISGGIWSGAGITNTSTGEFNPALANIGNNTIGYAASGLCPGTDTVIIMVVNAIPPSIAGNDLTICSGSTPQIGSAAVAGNTYSWFPTTGLSSATDADPLLTVENNGTVPIVIVYTLNTAGSGNICQSSDSIKVTINPNPALVITNPSPACIPNTVDITLAAVTAGSSSVGSISYWLDSLENTALSLPNAVSIAGTYFIVLTTTDGCKDYAPVEVVIDNVPIPDAGIDLIICTDEIVSIGGPTVAGYSYSWSPNLGLDSFNISKPFLTLINNGVNPAVFTYIVTAISNGCAAEDTVNITVSSLATVDAGPSKIICGNGGVTLAGIIGSAATVGTWTGGNGVYSPDNISLNAIYTPSPAEINAGLVILTLTTNDPPGNCLAASSSVTFDINPQATISAGQDDTICAGSTIQLNAALGGVATIGTWTGGGGIYNPNNTQATAVYTPYIAETIAGNVILIYTSDDPAGPCPAVTDSVTIFIMPLPIAIAGPDQNVCEGLTILLEGTIAGSASIGTWTGGTGTFSPDNTNLNAIYTPSAMDIAGDSIKLTLTTNNPIGLSCQVSSSDISIYFKEKPQINFTVDDTVGCIIHCVNFNDLTILNSGATINSWTWNFGDNSSISNSQNPSHCFSQAGIYDISLMVTSSEDCFNTFIAPQFIQVYSPPVAEYTPTPNPSTILNPIVSFNNFSSADVISWYWCFGDGDTLMLNSANPVHSFPTDIQGTYNTTLVVLNNYGCYDTVVYEIIIGPEFTFFIPNSFSPNNDRINDVFLGFGMGINKYELSIFDRWGKLIFNTKDINKGWDGKVNSYENVAQIDVYIWKVKIKDIFNKNHDYMGTVTIIK